MSLKHTDEEEALLHSRGGGSLRRTASSSSHTFDTDYANDTLHSSSSHARTPTTSTNTNTNKPPKPPAMGIFRVLTDASTWRASIAVIAIMTFQQATGVNSVMMYGVSVLSSVLPTSSSAINILVALVNPIITLLCAPLPDKLGRKPCLLLSIAGMGLSSLALGLGIINSLAPLSGLAVLTFVSSFALGLGPIPFILSSELVGPEAVGATQSWALASNWAATFAVAQFFPVVNERLGKGRVYFVFAGAAVVAGGFVAWWVPETKGRRDADEVWGRKGGGERED